MLTIHHLADFALYHANIAYFLIALGLIIEGEIVVILAGIFTHLGALNIFWSFFFIISAGILKSIIGYSLGFYLRNNHSHLSFLNKVQAKMNSFFPRFEKKPFWSIFLSRFLIFGIYWFALIFAGYQKTKLKTFIKADLLSLLVWSIFMFFLGYYFSQTALLISKDVRNFLGMTLVFFVGFFVLEEIIGFFIRVFENKYQ